MLMNNRNGGREGNLTLPDDSLLLLLLHPLTYRTRTTGNMKKLGHGEIHPTERVPGDS